MRLTMRIQLIALLALIAAGCKDKVSDNPKTEIFEDAVRIRPSVTSKYFKTDDRGASRDGKTLRGMVDRVVIRFDSSNKPVDTTVVFRDLLDSTVAKKPILIPLGDIQSINQIFPSVKAGEYGGINVFESFNVTKQIPILRPVAVDTLKPDQVIELKNDCNCKPFTFNAGLDLDIALRLRCNDREYSDLFVALLGRASAYPDGSEIINMGRINFGLDAIAGYRFGYNRRWMLGLTYSTGIATVDAGNIVPGVTSIDTLATEMRPLLLLTGRHYFTSMAKKPVKKSSSYFGIDISTDPNRPANAGDGETSDESWISSLFGCIKPYTYAEVGAALDAKTQAAMSMSMSGPECNECVKRLNDARLNGDVDLDWSLPVSYGLGVGIDVPVSSKLDIELDLGYRSIAVGDSYRMLGFDNVPDTRRIGSFQLRLGVTY